MNQHIEMMRLAEKEALKSVCKRAQVGAIHWAANGSLSYGHNFNADRDNFGGCCEGVDSKTLSTVLHAEEVVLLPVEPGDHDGGTLYVTRQPCIDCAGLIIHAGIEQVFYRDADDKTDGLGLLAAHGVKVDSGWIQGQVQPLIEPDLMQKIQDSWFARWPNNKQGDQHGASTISRAHQLGSGQGGNEVDEQGEKTNA